MIESVALFRAMDGAGRSSRVGLEARGLEAAGSE